MLYICYTLIHTKQLIYPARKLTFDAIILQQNLPLLGTWVGPSGTLYVYLQAKCQIDKIAAVALVISVNVKQVWGHMYTKSHSI